MRIAIIILIVLGIVLIVRCKAKSILTDIEDAKHIAQITAEKDFGKQYDAILLGIGENAANFRYYTIACINKPDGQAIIYKVYLTTRTPYAFKEGEYTGGDIDLYLKSHKHN